MPVRLRKLILVSLTGLLFTHFLIEVTGHHYLYKTIRFTILKGRLGPDIEEYKFLPNRKIENSAPQPWPSVNGAQPELLDDELSYHASNSSVAFLVIHRDTVIHESYWEDFGPDSISNSFSMAKSVVGLLTGIAIDQARIKGVDQPVYEHNPLYRDGLAEQLKIEHLLTMSSGINFDENYLNPFAFPARANYGDNLELLLTRYHVVDTPGVYYEYQSGNTQLLGQILTAAMRMSLSDMASEYVWKKIGAENPALWTLDREDGMEKAFCCINATARDFARIGRLYLHYGEWDGTRIVDSVYVARSLMPAKLKTRNGGVNKIYGYQWWLGKHGGYDFFFMRGIKGQYVMVVPDLDLIVVRLGRKRDVGSGNKPHPDDVYRYLDMGLRMIGKGIRI
ncbi:MAG: serine hydrolase [Salibacteraceae bacterium]